MLKTVNQTKAAGWMRDLASHYDRARAIYPNDRLIILFDVDGTIVDLRYMMLSLLREYDRIHGSKHFRHMGLSDIDVNENRMDDLLARMTTLSDEVREEVAEWYGSRYWDQDVMFESHRPFAGVMEVMRWFQIQPNTSVGINTARPEYMREDTLHSLNGLGREFKISFSSELVYMSPYAWDRNIGNSKCEGIRYFRRLGYRVVAFVDNEPENLAAVSEMEDSDEIMLLHADTLFESARSRLPRTTVSGDTYDITELAYADTLPRHVQFVWHGVRDANSLAEFIESGVQWCEMDVRVDPVTGRLVLTSDPIDDTLPVNLTSLDDVLDAVVRSERSIKLDIRENGHTLDELVAEIRDRSIPEDRLWFSANIDELGEGGFRRLRRTFPRAVVQCPVDFMAPLILAMPERAKEILSSLSEWGINRVSVKWDNLAKRQVLDSLENWGYEVNIYNVPDLESFLKAALLLPTSLTADFDSTFWPYPTVLA